MAHQVVYSVDITATPDVVWQRFLRVEEWPHWFPAMSAVQRAQRGAFLVGEELTLTLGMAGRSAAVRVKVSETHAHRVRWIGRSFGVTGDHSFFVTPTANGARFTSDETFRGLPLALVPRRYLDALHTEAIAGLDRFAALFTTRSPRCL